MKNNPTLLPTSPKQTAKTAKTDSPHRTAKRKREKPDFSIGGGGMIDPDFFPAHVRRDALPHLRKSKLTKLQQDSFMVYASDIAQMAMDGELIAASVQRAQIEKVAAAAHALKNAMALLQRPAKKALHAHTDYLTFGTAPPVTLPASVLLAVVPRGRGELLDTAWDWVDALQESAEYAVAQFAIDKTSKPALGRARGYVSLMAGYVKSMTGNAPPIDAAAWFAEVMVFLGDHLGLPIGPRVIASGIKAIR